MHQHLQQSPNVARIANQVLNHFLFCSQTEKVVLCNEDSKGKIQGWIGIKASSIHTQKNLQHVQVFLFLRLCGFRIILNTQLLTQGEI